MKFLLILVPIVFLASSCSKQVLFESLDGTPGPTFSEGPSACSSENTKKWEFSQPTDSMHKMDLLLVMDTSPSIWDEKSKIAREISAYMAALPADADLQIAILPGHGPLSRHFGKLHAAHGNPKVLQTQGMSLDAVQKQLKENLSCLPWDFTPGSGEYLFRSFLAATHGSKLVELKKLGFLREDARLTVVFVSDENDLCYCPKAHGFTQFPDYVASIFGEEEIGYELFCKDKKDQERYTPERVKARLDQLKGCGHYSVASIIHADGEKVPQSWLSEDSLGHGFIELEGQVSHNHTIEITQPSYAGGLHDLGLVSSAPVLQTSFKLGVLSPSELQSLEVKVDQKSVSFQKDISGSGEVTIILGDTGSPGSKISMSVCTLTGNQ